MKLFVCFGRCCVFQNDFRDIHDFVLQKKKENYGGHGHAACSASRNKGVCLCVCMCVCDRVCFACDDKSV